MSTPHDFFLFSSYIFISSFAILRREVITMVMVHFRIVYDCIFALLLFVIYVTLIEKISPIKFDQKLVSLITLTKEN